jgi:Icc-related predicted phosphoesterase
VPKCDLLLIGGDICASGSWPSQQAEWLDTTFRFWLDSVPASQVVAVAGNHDWAFEKWENRREFELTPGETDSLVVPSLRWHYLEDRGIELFGLRIYGTPWQPRFGRWAFSVEESVLAEKFAAIPERTDILLSHSPPFGICDLGANGKNSGSPSLLARVLHICPRLHIFGHIHDSRGRWQQDGITFANVAAVDRWCKLTHPPVMFELSSSSRQRSQEAV